jgi:hypothetical protein
MAAPTVRRRPKPGGFVTTGRLARKDKFGQSINYGLATVRYPVREVTATVEPFENGRGCTLLALAARKPRLKREMRCV